jgi:CDP-6-deoxy-D-xylo-4-hexulose-3-dehydrase
MKRYSELNLLRSRILDLVGDYAAAALASQPFEPGVTPIPASAKVIGAEELRNLVDASLDGWLTMGRFNDAFERQLAEFLGARYTLTTNSGCWPSFLARDTP